MLVHCGLPARPHDIRMNERDAGGAAELLDILNLETIEENLFRGRNEQRGGGRLFGGQVLGQSLAAASLTVTPDRPCHSLHAYFLRPGNRTVPVVYQVERIRDGRSFTTRRIVAIQRGEAIFSMDASFQLPEDGLHHTQPMPDIPGPDELIDDVDYAAQHPGSTLFSGWMTRDRPFEMRSAWQDPERRTDNVSNPIWLRFRAPVPEASRVGQYLLAYASDMGLVSTSMIPHRDTVKRDRVQMASLDHALWFHRQFDPNDWILYIKQTTAAAGSRGFNRGLFYTTRGELIAETMQEGLMRQHDPF